MSKPLTEEQRSQIERRFTLALAVLAAVLAVLPFVRGLMSAPPGSSYLGYQFNTDDHMVYSAWMRQAMENRLLFDNRFAVDAQPGLTLHLYFLLLGQIARVTGLAFAATLGRIAFSVLFVFLIARLIRKAEPSVFGNKLGLSLAIFGGGLGFLVWHNFGVLIVRPAPDFLKEALLSRLPTDVWQPEGFVFSSMLTNGLFMVSLCLIALVLLAVLEARESPNWRPVAVGAGAMALLMNIHSYDVLMVTFALVGLLAASVVTKQADKGWILKTIVIGLGALPFAFWFMHVLANDPVFQERAATPTYAPNFRAVIAGYFMLIVPAFAALWYGNTPDQKPELRRKVGLGLVLVLVAGLWVL